MLCTRAEPGGVQNVVSCCIKSTLLKMVPISVFFPGKVTKLVVRDRTVDLLQKLF